MQKNVVHGIDPHAALQSTREGSRFPFALETRAGAAPRGSIACRIRPSNLNNRPQRTIPVATGAMVLFPDVPPAQPWEYVLVDKIFQKGGDGSQGIARYLSRNVRASDHHPPGAILNADFRRSIAELNVTCDDDSYDAVARSCAFQDALEPPGRSLSVRAQTQVSLAHLDPETMDDWAPVGDEASWRRCIDAWDGGVGARRRKKVLELARHAASKFASANHKEQLVGLEQVFELSSLRANLHGITDVLLDDAHCSSSPTATMPILRRWCRGRCCRTTTRSSSSSSSSSSSGCSLSSSC